MLVLGWLLLCGLSSSAQVPLELESETMFFITPDGKTLLTRLEYEERYRRDNSFQASNAVTVKVQHFNQSVTVSDMRKKPVRNSKSRTKGPVVQISLSFTRPLFDAGFASFTKLDLVTIQKILTKFKEWAKSSYASPSGTQLRRPFPEAMAWPVTTSANNVVTLTELPLLFMRDADRKLFLIFDKDKDFPGGMEELAPAAGGQGAEEGGAAAKVKSKVVDHWMGSVFRDMVLFGDIVLFEAVLQKVDAILKENQVAIQKLK